MGGRGAGSAAGARRAELEGFFADSSGVSVVLALQEGGYSPGAPGARGTVAGVLSSRDYPTDRARADRASYNGMKRRAKEAVAELRGRGFSMDEIEAYFRSRWF